MPIPEIGQKDEKTWMGECVPMMIAEGKDNEQAVAICTSAYKTKQLEVPSANIPPIEVTDGKPKIQNRNSC